MSRAIVIQPGAFERFMKKLQHTVTAIRKAGFPELGAEIVPLHSNIPYKPNIEPIYDCDLALSMADCLSISVDGFPQNIVHGKEPHTQMSDYEKNTAFTEIPTRENIHIPKQEHEDIASISIAQLQSNRHRENDALKDAIMESLKCKNLEVKSADSIGNNITRITLSDYIGDKNIKIPEYVMVKRQYE
ncbi:MAG: hypothetical protein AB2L22_13265 [Syntrophales bacterium]